MKQKTGLQMSSSLPVMILLNLSGGTQDACSYFLRDHVFANAQTGNIVLMGCYLISEDLRNSIRYFLPVAFFALGVLMACLIHSRFRHTGKIHWRHLVLTLEIILLFIVGFIPGQLNWLANGLTSFACAMQVQSFRTVRGSAYASTMCIGNMRSGMEALSAYIRTHDRNVLGKALRYWEIIFLFAVGAGIGGQFVVLFGAHTIWFSCLLLLVSFCLMFIREEMKEHPEISVEEETIQKDLWDIEKQIKNIGHQVGEDISVMKSPHNKDSQ